MGLLDEQLSEEERYRRALATIEAAQKEKDFTFGQSEPPQMLPSFDKVSTVLADRA